MSDERSTKQLGWRIPEPLWDTFTATVESKWGEKSDAIVRFELQRAMTEFMDIDEHLVDSLEVLNTLLDLRGLFSSTDEPLSREIEDEQLKTIGSRIPAVIKEQFKSFVSEEFNDGTQGQYGGVTSDYVTFEDALTLAIREYCDGGLSGLVCDRLKQLASGSTEAGRNSDVDENPDSSLSTRDDIFTTVDENDCSQDLADEGQTVDDDSEPTPTTLSAHSNTMSRSEETTATQDPDARLVLDIVDEITAGFENGVEDISVLHRQQLDSVIQEIAAPQNPQLFERYLDAVCEQLNAAPHPHKDGVFITESFRGQATLYADLDTCEQVCLLRRWAAAAALSDRKRRESWAYKEVIGLFEAEAGGGSPSHTHAYSLMEMAADADGFSYGEYETSGHGTQKQLRVNISDVDESILDWCRDERSLDPKLIGAIADIDSYQATQPDVGGVGADD